MLVGYDLFLRLEHSRRVFECLLIRLRLFFDLLRLDLSVNHLDVGLFLLLPLLRRAFANVDGAALVVDLAFAVLTRFNNSSRRKDRSLDFFFRLSFIFL